MLYVLKKDGSFFNLAGQALKNNPKVILTALMNTQDSNVIPYLDKALQEELANQNPVMFFESKIKESKKKTKLKMLKIKRKLRLLFIFFTKFYYSVFYHFSHQSLLS